MIFEVAGNGHNDAIVIASFWPRFTCLSRAAAWPCCPLLWPVP